MPSKKIYNVRFPAGRIKKIMQTDEEVGKVAQAVPFIISRTLELFVHSLLTKTMQITNAKKAKTLSPLHMKQCILSESRFDFLKDLVKGIPDVAGPDDEAQTPPLTPATMPITMAPSVAGLPPNIHSDGRVPREIMNSPLRTSRSSRNSRDDLENPSEDSIKMFTPSMSTTTSMISEQSQILLPPPPPPQQQYHVPNFQISIPSSFAINQPNFYTEIDPANPTMNSSSIAIGHQPTTNFNQTANIDEDYDT